MNVSDLLLPVVGFDSNWPLIKLAAGGDLTDSSLAIIEADDVLIVVGAVLLSAAASTFTSTTLCSSKSLQIELGVSVWFA